eukprot:gene1325-371_t
MSLGFESMDELREMSNVAIACSIFKKNDILSKYATDVFSEDDLTGADLVSLVEKANFVPEVLKSLLSRGGQSNLDLAAVSALRSECKQIVMKLMEAPANEPDEEIEMDSEDEEENDADENTIEKENDEEMASPSEDEIEETQEDIFRVSQLQPNKTPAHVKEKFGSKKKIVGGLPANSRAIPTPGTARKSVSSGSKGTARKSASSGSKGTARKSVYESFGEENESFGESSSEEEVVVQKKRAPSAAAKKKAADKKKIAEKKKAAEKSKKRKSKPVKKERVSQASSAAAPKPKKVAKKKNDDARGSKRKSAEPKAEPKKVAKKEVRNSIVQEFGKKFAPQTKGLISFSNPSDKAGKISQPWFRDCGMTLSNNLLGVHKARDSVKNLERITHLILDASEPMLEDDVPRGTSQGFYSKKMLYAMAKGAWILTPDWLTESADAQEWQEEKNYQHPDFPPLEDRNPNIAFDVNTPLRITFRGNFPEESTTELGAADMRRLIRLCGGEVVRDFRCDAGWKSADFCVCHHKLGRMEREQMSKLNLSSQGAEGNGATTFVTAKWLIDCIAKGEFCRPSTNPGSYCHSVSKPVPDSARFASQISNDCY